jgi:hypothetical protein
MWRMLIDGGVARDVVSQLLEQCLLRLQHALQLVYAVSASASLLLLMGTIGCVVFYIPRLMNLVDLPSRVSSSLP